jgi:hypothetical protein
MVRRKPFSFCSAASWLRCRLSCGSGLGEEKGGEGHRVEDRPAQRPGPLARRARAWPCSVPRGLWRVAATVCTCKEARPRAPGHPSGLGGLSGPPSRARARRALREDGVSAQGSAHWGGRKGSAQRREMVPTPGQAGAAGRLRLSPPGRMRLRASKSGDVLRKARRARAQGGVRSSTRGRQGVGRRTVAFWRARKRCCASRFFSLKRSSFERICGGTGGERGRT